MYVFRRLISVFGSKATIPLPPDHPQCLKAKKVFLWKSYQVFVIILRTFYCSNLKTILVIHFSTEGNHCSLLLSRIKIKISLCDRFTEPDLLSAFMLTALCQQVGQLFSPSLPTERPTGVLPNLKAHYHPPPPPFA